MNLEKKWNVIESFTIETMEDVNWVSHQIKTNKRGIDLQETQAKLDKVTIELNNLQAYKTELETLISQITALDK